MLQGPSDWASRPALQTNALRGRNGNRGLEGTAEAWPKTPPPPRPTPGVRASCRGPGSPAGAPPAARPPARVATLTLHFAEGADAQCVPQHVMSDLHPPIVLLLLSHVPFRAPPPSAAGPQRLRRRSHRRLPTVQRARGAGRGRQGRGARWG